MKTYFSQKIQTERLTEEDYSPVTLRDSIEKPARRWISPMRALIMQ